VSGISISGTDAGNYTFNTTASTTANITQRALIVSATGIAKVYDGMTTATVTLADNRVAGDVFTDSYTSASFSDANAGTGKTVNVTGISISGTDAGNYTYNTTATTTADITKATITVSANSATKVLNAPNPTFTASYSGFVNGETATTALTGSPSLTTTATTTSPVGNYQITAALGTLAAANYSFTFPNVYPYLNPLNAFNTLTIVYAGSGTCDGDVGHAILQPVNPDGSSVFKFGSTVPIKFRVCDANGVSIGSPTTVATTFTINVLGSDTAPVDETIVSTTPDTAFRWDSTNQQWIFNLNTRGTTINGVSLQPATKYQGTIPLNDGTTITFIFALK
jgi:hypothetical protein